MGECQTLVISYEQGKQHTIINPNILYPIDRSPLTKEDNPGKKSQDDGEILKSRLI